MKENLPSEAKRVVTKLGDVFETSDKLYLIQLVAIDEVNLNSDVAVVYEANNITDRSNLANQPSLFYTHTTLSTGVRAGLWVKIGKSTICDSSKLRFKTYFGPDEADILSETHPKLRGKPHWTTWTPADTDWRIISEQAGIKLIAEEGGIVPPAWVIERIKNGGKDFEHLNWPGIALQPRLNEVSWLNQGYGTPPNSAIFHVENDTWFAMGGFSLFDAYDRAYNKNKPLYRKQRGNPDGDMGYIFEFIACSPDFPKVAHKYITYDYMLPFVVVEKPNIADITEALRLKVGHYYFKTIKELRDHLAEFAEVGELDYALEQMSDKTL